MALAQTIAPFLWNGNQAVTKAELDRQRKLADALRAPAGYAPKGAWSLLGGLAGEGAATFRDSQADAAEAEKQKVIADALTRGDYQSVLGSDFSTPQQSAIASALMGRKFDLEDRSAQWGHEEDLQDRGWQHDAATVADERNYNEPIRDLQIDSMTTQNDLLKNPRQYRSLITPEERAAYGLDPADTAPYQVAPDNTLVPVMGKGGGGITINTGDNGGADADFYKAGSTARGKVFADLESTGIDAQARAGQIGQLEQILSTAPQGFEGAWKQMAGEAGIPTEGLSDIQAATAIINKMVPTQRTPGSGTMSDADLALFKASLPRIINQPEGNALIIQTIKAIASYDQQIGDIATQVLNKEITPAEGREAMKAVPNPLEALRKGAGNKAPGAPPEGIDAAVWGAMTDEERALWN